MAAGIALSGIWMGGGAFDATCFALAFAGLLLFMVLARLTDEMKDYEKDTVAHPERPLPRGLLTPAAVRRAIVVLFAAMCADAALLALGTGWLAVALYAASAGWLRLMSREFFARAALAPRPLVSAVPHQLVLFPLYGFAMAVRAPEVAFGPPGLAYALTNLGASMVIPYSSVDNVLTAVGLALLSLRSHSLFSLGRHWGCADSSGIGSC